MVHSYSKYLWAFLLIALSIRCGDPPTDPPQEQTGALLISGMVDTTIVDSVYVYLDDDSLGLKENPCLIDDITCGTHQVMVASDDPDSPIDYQSIPQMVDISKDKTTGVSAMLSKFAPNFSLTSIENETVSLENYRGNIVFLVFFTHT